MPKRLANGHDLSLAVMQAKAPSTAQWTAA